MPSDRKEYMKDYAKTSAGRKVLRIANWKNNKIICDDWDLMYERFINTERCECCNKVFAPPPAKDKHLDHNHQTGKIRNILCRNCNQLRGHIDKDYKLIMKLITMC
tara:strand:- start:1334 stop:1651 length:318 start_codon:yes stop_codon:yes gene_type:complete